MKHTKSMIIKETAESRELELFAENTARVYNSFIVPVVRNLAKKYAKGIFDAEKAIDAFYPAACAASDMYAKEFGYRFSVGDRFTAAAYLAVAYMENIERNDL